jgi:hypothetical protein
MVFEKQLMSFALPVVMTKAVTEATTKAVAATWYKKADCTCRG